MTEFDKIINEALANKKFLTKLELKIKKAKEKTNKKAGRVKPPNTPGNIPVHKGSPALQKGINKDIADTPMPMSVGV